MTSLNRPGGNKSIRFIIGKSVTVTVDRTYVVRGEDGKRHTVNCGYIGLTDGRIERQAIVIGVEQALAEFTGHITAVITLEKTIQTGYMDCVASGAVFYEPGIRTLVSRFVKVKNPVYVCLYEKSCGAVMFSEEDGERKFILIKNMSGHIGFPKWSHGVRRDRA